MTSTPTTRSTILAIAFAALATSCAADDPLVQPTTTTIEPEGVNVGFADPATAGPGHAGSIPATSTTTSTTTTTTTAPPTTTSSAPPTTTTAAPRPRATNDVPAPILDAVQSLWPEDEWDRALSVAFCESNYRLDAANPTSSARGVFQLLAPWTRDPGSGRTVWGWDYTDDGEKLSAAAGLGIAQEDARTGLANITVAHRIWQSEGWVPWAASQLCWAE